MSLRAIATRSFADSDLVSMSSMYSDKGVITSLQSFVSLTFGLRNISSTNLAESSWQWCDLSRSSNASSAPDSDISTTLDESFFSWMINASMAKITVLSAVEKSIFVRTDTEIQEAEDLRR
ncbi:hypothetical protein HID58_066880 [Brassica napus]|uniref:Uncharacterized protein n=1 Tax=Brassica napus TaxID=3708 RepID=A0ABQ7ZHF8_BRANA|nr:hypothetical protein HID58_066880 [Brassica napus]